MGPKSEGWNFSCSGQKTKKHFRKMVTKWMRSDRKDGWNTGSQLPTVVAMTGALVVIAIIIRSLYLMFIKPDTA